MLRPPLSVPIERTVQEFQDLYSRLQQQEARVEGLRASLSIAAINLISASIVAHTLGSEDDARVFRKAADQVQEALDR